MAFALHTGSEKLLARKWPLTHFIMNSSKLLMDNDFNVVSMHPGPSLNVVSVI